MRYSCHAFLGYRLLRNSLEAGDRFCQDSVRCRSFADGLLDDQRWQAKEVLIVDPGLPILPQPFEALDPARRARSTTPVS
jgi:hypothetical protein